MTLHQHGFEPTNKKKEPYKGRSPTEKQIQKADEIARVLGIDFPQSSKDFTYVSYGKFIREHEEAYNRALNKSS